MQSYHPPLRLVLASASPRRRDLLMAAGFDLEVIPADIDEGRLVDEAPDRYVRRLARAKADAVTARLPSSRSAVVLGADTVVVMDDEVIGKPRDAVDAVAMLRRLSGRTHQVLTGVALVRGAEHEEGVESTAVTFAELDESAVARYVATGEPLDKAGAYGIQGGASRFVERIEGSYTNVVGLPLTRLDRMIQSLLARV